MADPFYNSPEWIAVRDRVRARGGNACSVGRLLGGDCSATLAVHHIAPRSERPDLALDEANLRTVCVRHHPTWESLRRVLRARIAPRCPHRHRYREGRIACERALARRAA